MGTSFADKARLITEFVNDEDFVVYDDAFVKYLDDNAVGLGLAEAYTYAGMQELSPSNAALVEGAWVGLCAWVGLDPEDTYYEAYDLNPGNL